MWKDKPNSLVSNKIQEAHHQSWADRYLYFVNSVVISQLLSPISPFSISDCPSTADMANMSSVSSHSGTEGCCVSIRLCWKYFLLSKKVYYGDLFKVFPLENKYFDLAILTAFSFYRYKINIWQSRTGTIYEFCFEGIWLTNLVLLPSLHSCYPEVFLAFMKSECRNLFCFFSKN